MEWAVDVAGETKVVMSGGSKTSDEAFLSTVEDAMAAGASGLAVGRNVFQREDPIGILDALEAVIFDGATAAEALELAGAEAALD
jgi:class I fructose-bisphosphate aldolase